MTYDINGFYDFLSSNPNFSGEDIAEHLKMIKKLSKSKVTLNAFGPRITDSIDNGGFATEWCNFLEKLDNGTKYEHGFNCFDFLYDEIKKHFFSNKNPNSLEKFKSLAYLLSGFRKLDESHFFVDGQTMGIISVDKKGRINYISFPEFIKKLMNCQIRDEVKLLMEI